jgi:hypothetical protein
MSIVLEIEKIQAGEFEEGGLHGCALDLVQQIINLPGEYYSDQECMRMIHYLANAWSKLEDQGKY